MKASSDFDRLCEEIHDAVSSICCERLDRSAATLKVTDRRVAKADDPTVADERPEYEIEVTPANERAARISIIVWPSIELLVTVGRNGMALELFDESRRRLVELVRELFDAVLHGRVIERLERDADDNPVALFTSILGEDGAAIWEVEGYEGGTGRLGPPLTYESY